MAPRPDDDDIVVEPADNDGLRYGNSSMEGTSTGQRPYIRLTSKFQNLTKDSGNDVRFKCEAIGTQPLNFMWLKNNAPVEKSKRVRIRNKESSSRLIIQNLDVLDSGYYQCVVSNSAASVNTTSILRVNNVPDALKKSKARKEPSFDEYEDYELMDRGRLPDEEEADLYRVPDTAGGSNYAPVGVSERWLDGVKYRVGDCVPYRGEACRNYLSNRYVMMTNESREEMYDIDRNLRAAMLFINGAPTISQDCRQLSEAVACHHMYKICDSDATNQIVSICKHDCDQIQNHECPSELALAAQHELVGDTPKALFPMCSRLSSTSNCIPVMNFANRNKNPSNSDARRNNGQQQTHWCYVNSGTQYEGSASQTVTGKTCASWRDSTAREYNIHRYPELGAAKNYCRNPGGKKSRPWCYSTLGQEEYCDLPQCPPDMYPHLSATEGGGKAKGSSTSGGGVSESITALWDSLEPTTQVGVVCGGVFFSLFLLLLFCCACCCRAKKKKTSTAAGKGRNNNNIPLHCSNAPSIINSAANSAYYRKLNGTSTPIMARGGHEMTSLLGPPPYPVDLPPSFPPPVDDNSYRVLEIAPSQLVVRELIGEGQFGVVHSGIYTSGLFGPESMTVAVKKCRLDATNAERASLEQEIRTVASFDHPNVIKLIGVCYFDGNLTAVFEYMVHGDLHDLLRLRAPSGIDHDLERVTSDNADFLNIATQIAQGMEYLASMSFVHRDLATRNCLVGDNRTIKIADFGLMRTCYDTDYYKMLHRSWMPVRWMSKESIEQGRFSEASDVWSYGITLWEVWSYGRQPYEGANNQQVIELIANRHLLECPHNCPTNIYSLMVECWHENTDRRPTFSEVRSRLQSWSLASPAHSILQQQQQQRAGSHSGSSGAGRIVNPSRPGTYQTSASKHPHHHRSRGLDGASPLMKRHDANYAYSEDGDSD